MFAKGAGAAFFSTVSLQVNGTLCGTISNPANICGVLSLTEITNDYAEGAESFSSRRMRRPKAKRAHLWHHFFGRPSYKQNQARNGRLFCHWQLGRPKKSSKCDSRCFFALFLVLLVVTFFLSDLEFSKIKRFLFSEQEKRKTETNPTKK